MSSCCKCHKPAVTYIRYNGNHLCRNHFNRFVEDRVKKELRKQVRLCSNEVIAVALSGGKDSSVVLYLLNNFLSIRRGFHILALTVDEGIKGYRNGTIKSAKALCTQLGIEHRVVRFREEIGHTIDDLSKRKWIDGEFAPCTYCGVFRRLCLNKSAKEIGATRLATGLNLDDTVQSILMNICRGDVDKFARMGPHVRLQKGLVPRIQPLRTIPEKEVFLYATLNNIQFDHSECPYSRFAARNRFRDIVASLEDCSPGTRHAVLVSADRITNLLIERSRTPILKKCEKCGEPTGQDLCKACDLLGKINTGKLKKHLY